MPKVQRRKGVECEVHQWACQLGGGDHVSTWCSPKRRDPVSKWQEPVGELPEDAEMVEWTRQAKAKLGAEVEGITVDEALARYDAEQVAAAARRARMTPRQLAADTDRVLDGIAPAKARMRAEDDAAAQAAAEQAAAAAIEAAEQAARGGTERRPAQRPSEPPSARAMPSPPPGVADLATARTRRTPRPRIRVTYPDWNEF